MEFNTTALKWTGALSTVALGGAAMTALTSCAQANAKPEMGKAWNVVFIITDDQGYGDVGFTGNEHIKTPNIDALANNGISFTNYHTGTTSAPTRSGIQTGKYCNQVGVWHTIQGRELLDPNETTIGQIFQANGYKTSLYGKWHIGDNYPYRPCDRGYGETLWHKGGGVQQTPDYWNNDYFDDVYFRNDKPEQQEGYCTDVFFNNAIDFISRNKDENFFCMISLNAPHGPYHVAEKYVTQYRDNKNIPNPQFYGMITNIDDNIGILRNKLEELGISDNTVIIFTTDNGSAGGLKLDRKTRLATAGYNAGMAGKKGDVWEGGHRTPFVLYFPNGEKKELNQLAGYVDVAPTLIDICGLKYDNMPAFEGMSLVPVFNEGKTIDRYLFADTQRKEYLDFSRPSVAMKGSWRLVNNKKLFNLDNDPGEQKNIAKQHPEIVKELRKAHKTWWEKQFEANSKISYIPVPAKGGEDVVINCHDMHDPENRPNVWNQMKLREGLLPAISYYAIDIKEAGKYTVELYRWPVESGLKLTAIAPEGAPIPNGITPPEGKAIADIIGGEVLVGAEKSYKATPKNIASSTCIQIKHVEFPAGEQQFVAKLLRKGDDCGAFFIKFIKE